ncbi:S-layer homology domain-containing protein [Rubeoparvulum massiliense]|uniref:S-layer homology domain-containing protein n=1 Tax=Rubeoparvulum massiliense TaxID=1631346 RepID=UPI00065DE668|nr:S-layer homology domain-containing protein [Rubeoparvulum massiliense]
MKRAKQLLVLLLLFTWLLLIPIGAASMSSYQDMKRTDWAYSSLQLLTLLQVVEGYPDHTFRPDQALSREEWTKLFAVTMKLKDISVREEFRFADLPKSHWSYPYVMRGYQYQIIDHLLESRSFQPAKAIERQEVARMIGGYLLQRVPAVERGEWLSKGWKEWWIAHPFTDGEACREEYRPYIAYTASIGMMVGDPDGQFRPTASLSRREGVALLARMVKKENEARSLTTSYLQLPNTKLLKLDEESGIASVVIPWSPVEKGPVIQEGLAKQQQQLLVTMETASWNQLLKDAGSKEKVVTSIKEELQQGAANWQRILLYLPADLKQPKSSDLVSLIQELKVKKGSSVIPVDLILPATWDAKQLEQELKEQVGCFYVYPKGFIWGQGSFALTSWFEGTQQIIHEWTASLTPEKMVLLAPVPNEIALQPSLWKNEWYEAARYYRFQGILWIPTY